MDVSSVLVSPHRFHLDVTSRTNPFEHQGLFVDTFGRDDKQNRLANRLACGVTEHPFSTGIPRRDDAVEVLAEDGIVGRLDDGRNLLRHARRCFERLQATHFAQLSRLPCARC